MAEPQWFRARSSFSLHFPYRRNNSTDKKNELTENKIKTHTRNAVSHSCPRCPGFQTDSPLLLPAQWQHDAPNTSIVLNHRTSDGSLSLIHTRSHVPLSCFFLAGWESQITAPKWCGAVPAQTFWIWSEVRGAGDGDGVAVMAPHPSRGELAKAK